MDFKLKDLPLRAAETFDLPADVISSLPHLELMGDLELLMTGHRGILSYSTDSVDINGGGLIVRLRGKQLELTAMTDHEVRIRGTITGVELMR